MQTDQIEPTMSLIGIGLNTREDGDEGLTVRVSRKDSHCEGRKPAHRPELEMTRFG